MDAREEYGIGRHRRGPSAGTVIVLAIIFGALAGFGGTLAGQAALQRNMLPWQSAQGMTTPGSPQTTQPIVARGGGLSFADIADAMNESVVNINTLARQENPMAFFFGGSGSQVVRGLGTGMILDTKGHILTNYHVVKGAENIKVTVMHAAGKKEYKATLIGGDEQEDLAVIKIDAPNLKPVRFGNSDQLRPGDAVMAIGNPFGFEHTVSVGVVSALNRSLPVDDAVTLRGMIQTDASINPGNSGGPLMNVLGEVIGVNSAIYVGRGNGQPQANGIGFSIPSNHTQRIVEQLLQRKKIQHPFVGISYSVINDELRQEKHLPAKDGVLIQGVIPNGPAAKAGLRPNDILMSADGKPLADENALADHISRLTVGQTVTFKVYRWNNDRADWTETSVKVKVGDKPANLQQQPSQPQPEAPAPQDEPGPMFPFPW